VYAREAQEPEWAKVALVADPDSPLKRALDGLRVRYDLLPPGAALPAGGVLIVGGGPAAWRWLEDHAAALPTWAANGGRLWLDNVPPSEAGTLGAILGEPVTLRPAETVPVTLTRPDPLTTGLSNHELYWRDRPIWDQWTALRPVADWVPEGRTGALTDPPVLTRIPFDYAGRGGVVLNQMLWTTTEGVRLEARRSCSPTWACRWTSHRSAPPRRASTEPWTWGRTPPLAWKAIPRPAGWATGRGRWRAWRTAGRSSAGCRSCWPIRRHTAGSAWSRCAARHGRTTQPR
ncbi:MAG: hypothetical protein HYU66_22875, partial [Armatimonadetes bacterium]|nr:hypothetical protein [Armatimonadota bacterium]